MSKDIKHDGYFWVKLKCGDVPDYSRVRKINGKVEYVKQKYLYTYSKDSTSYMNGGSRCVFLYAIKESGELAIQEELVDKEVLAYLHIEQLQALIDYQNHVERS